MIKKATLVFIITVIILLSSCVAGDPWPEPQYFKDIFPGATSTYFLGSNDLRWAGIYSDNITTTNLVVEGDITFYDQITLADDGKVWLEFRPDLDFSTVRANGKPTHVSRGEFEGFSLPVFSADDEELFFDMCVPGRWWQPAWTYLGDVGDEPGGMAVYDEMLFIPCEADDNVWVYDGETFSISGNVGDAPVYSYVYQDKLYVTCSGDDTVWVYNGATWAKSGDVGNSPEGMEVYEGDLYVACRLDDEIWRLSGGVWAVDPALGAGGVAGAVDGMPTNLYSYGGDLYTSCAGDDDVWIRNAGAWAKDDDVGDNPQEFQSHNGDLYLTCEDDDDVWVRSGGVWAVASNVQIDIGNAPIGIEEYGGDLFVACMSSIWSDISDFWNQNSDFNEVTADEPMFLKNYNDRLYCSCKVGDGIWVYEGETAYIHIHCWTPTIQGNVTDAFRLDIEYENFTAGVDIVPNTGDDVIVETVTGVAAGYQSYLVQIPLDMTGVENEDNMGLCLQRIASSDEIAGEVVINHFGMIFLCDKLGNPTP